MLEGLLVRVAAICCRGMLVGMAGGGHDDLAGAATATAGRVGWINPSGDGVMDSDDAFRGRMWFVGEKEDSDWTPRLVRFKGAEVGDAFLWHHTKSRNREHAPPHHSIISASGRSCASFRRAAILRHNTRFGLLT